MRPAFLFLLACTSSLALSACSSDDAAPAASAGCVHDADCAASLICLFRTCTPPCTADRDCAPGARCVKSPNGAGCVTATQASCTTTCEDGATCAVDHQCRAPCEPGPTLACLAGQSCVGAVCVGSDGSHDTASASALGQGGGAGASGGQGGGSGASVGGHAGSQGGHGGAGAHGGSAGSGGSPGGAGGSLGGAAGSGGISGGAGAAGAAGSAGSAASGGAAGSGGNAGTGGASGTGGATSIGTDTTLAVGMGQACALRAGAVDCWGYAANVLTGDSSTNAPLYVATPSALPQVAAAEPGGFASIAVLGQHACAIGRATRDLVCWGDNRFGAVGTLDPEYAAPTVLPIGGDVAEARLTADGTCARFSKTGENVACWGNPVFGILGPNGATPSPTPVVIPGVTDATLLRTGRRVGCAAGAAGTWCWGGGSSDVQSIPFSDVADLAVGGIHPTVFALDANGDVTFSAQSLDAPFAWSAPKAATDLSGNSIGKASAIVASVALCAVSLDRTSVKCLGFDTNGPTSPPNDFTFGGAKVTHIAAGYADPDTNNDDDPSGSSFVGCFELESGSVQCVGNDEWGMVGTGKKDLARKPTTIAAVTSPVSIWGSARATAAVASSGTVTAWGASASLFSDPYPHTPEVLAFGSSLTSAPSTARVRAGALQNRAYVVDGTTGGVALQGGNVTTAGTLVDDGLAYKDAQNGFLLDVGLVAGDMVVRVLELPNYSDVGLTTSQATDAKGTYVPVTTAAIAEIAFDAWDHDAGQHLCALGADGSVSCWGENSRGQCGTGSAQSPVTTPSIAVAAGGASAICVGHGFSCAVHPGGGGVACWGDNSHGAVAPEKPHDTAAHSIPNDVTGAPAAIGVTCGEHFVCAWTSNAVACWGDDSWGQLGDPKAPLAQSSSSVVAVTGLSAQTITSVVAGDRHACALLATGEVRCWGTNGEGQIGGTQTDFHATPEVLSFP